MAAHYHQDIVNIDLDCGNIHRCFLRRSIGTGDSNANRFGVRVFRGKDAVDLTGVSCQGYFRNSQGENIALTSHGTVEGNKAFVTLPQACYNYDGQFTLAIKLVGGGITGTMRIIDGMVDNTNTGGAVAPTADVPTYQEILAVYEEMLEALETVDEMKDTVEMISEKVENLYKRSNVVIGKAWSGGTNAKRAIVDIPAEAETNYTFEVGESEYFTRIAVIPLIGTTSPAGDSVYYALGSKNVFQTTATTTNIRVQFESDNTITSAMMDALSLFVYKGTEDLTAKDKVARDWINKTDVNKRKFIFIGDSYCEGYNPDGNVTGWGERLKTQLGLDSTHCKIKYKGGTGFYHVSDGKTFSTLLDEAGAEVNKNEITDIVICGGWNDNSETVGNIYNAVLAVVQKVRDEYKNARLNIGMIGASNDSTVKGRLQNNVLYAYQYGAGADVCNYLNNVEYALSESNLASDSIHPNEDGQVQITFSIKQAIMTGSAYIPYRFLNQIKTS